MQSSRDRDSRDEQLKRIQNKSTNAGALERLFDSFLAKQTPHDPTVLHLRRRVLTSLQKLHHHDVEEFHRLVIELLAIAGATHSLASEGTVCASPQAPADPPEDWAIPDYSPNDDQWISARECATIERLLVSSLATYRKRYNARHFASDEMSGVDRDGRMWRRIGTPGSWPLYYTPSLKNS